MKFLQVRHSLPLNISLYLLHDVCTTEVRLALKAFKVIVYLIFKLRQYQSYIDLT